MYLSLLTQKPLKSSFCIFAFPLISQRGTTDISKISRHVLTEKTSLIVGFFCLKISLYGRKRTSRAATVLGVEESECYLCVLRANNQMGSRAKADSPTKRDCLLKDSVGDIEDKAVSESFFKSVEKFNMSDIVESKLGTPQDTVLHTPFISEQSMTILAHSLSSYGPHSSVRLAVMMKAVV